MISSGWEGIPQMDAGLGYPSSSFLSVPASSNLQYSPPLNRYVLPLCGHTNTASTLSGTRPAEERKPHSESGRGYPGREIVFLNTQYRLPKKDQNEKSQNKQWRCSWIPQPVKIRFFTHYFYEWVYCSCFNSLTSLHTHIFKFWVSFFILTNKEYNISIFSLIYCINSDGFWRQTDPEAVDQSWSQGH